MTTPSKEGLLDRVRAVVPLIAANAERAERERKPVDEVIEALKETGVFRSFVPPRYGGYDLDFDTFIDIGIAVAEACVSTGWITTFYMEHNWLFAHFGQKAQDEIFGAQPYILAPASVTPVGEATAEKGGFRLSGRWPWGSGIMHADWVMVNGVVKGPHLPPLPRLFILPVGEVSVADTWFASGMCGTGSNDIVIDGVFVPEHRAQEILSLAIGRSPGSRFHGSPAYRIPMAPFLGMTAGIPVLGAARRAVALFQERLGQRVLFGSDKKQIEFSSAQTRLGHARVAAQSAERLMRGVAHDLRAWGERAEPCPIEERARLRLQIGYVVRTCRDVVRDLLDAGGAGAHMSAHPLQRIGRDVDTLASHIMFDPDIAGETYGRLLLGLEPRFLT